MSAAQHAPSPSVKASKVEPDANTRDASTDLEVSSDQEHHRH
jgi:hypothetical protein